MSPSYEPISSFTLHSPNTNIVPNINDDFIKIINDEMTTII